MAEVNAALFIGEPTSSTGALLDVAIEDWELLFDAVTSRLRSTAAGAALDEGAQAQVREVALRLRSVMLECVVALGVWAAETRVVPHNRK